MFKLTFVKDLERGTSEVVIPDTPPTKHSPMAVQRPDAARVTTVRGLSFHHPPSKAAKKRTSRRIQFSLWFNTYRKKSPYLTPSARLANFVGIMAANRPPTKSLSFSDGPLVWIDCEMTGLSPATDKILEIAVLITNGDLDLVDDGIEFVVNTDKHSLDKHVFLSASSSCRSDPTRSMNEWCVKQHGSTGLTQACLDSPHSHAHVESEVLKYIQSHIPGRGVGILAGNSVHADRSFLSAHMPSITDWLHYRIVDVSTIKELHRRWYPQKQFPKSESNHRALDDIRGSVRELKWYRDNIFV
ncbi:ribonuclease H-like domain-containing protein [Amylostereum chailletii]|nr:ribonuclease H-like domain-containing protein [Amylostereum chailletii]